MAVRVGVSGWSYPQWRGDFYPRGLRHSAELSHVASRMTALEINASFYRLQRPATYARWAEETPPTFRFAVKGSRYISHLRSLRDVRVPLANFLASGPLVLGERLGPMLWQLPANLAYHEEAMSAFLSLLPRTTTEAAELAREHDARILDEAGRSSLDGASVDTASAVEAASADAERPLRHAIEPRHPSFGSPAAVAALTRHQVALVVADSAGEFPTFDQVTTDLTYVRLHGPEQLYGGGYDAGQLERWAARVRRWHETTGEAWVFFDNDADGRAPHDAVALSTLLADLLPSSCSHASRPPGITSPHS